MGEFELIERYFKRPALAASSAAPGVVLGIGDDCALLHPQPGMQLAVSTDMLVSGRHFFADVNPRTLGHKALAVNLSDLAACGARPLGFTLALALPEADEAWLAEFSAGLFALADSSNCPLVGGDTTKGPLTISITVFGEVPAGQALLRSGAQVGDEVWVSGTLGDARLALGALRGEWTLPPTLLEQARVRLEQPTPRLALGQALRGIASAAADVSDGLLGDLGHILKASGVGATLRAANAIGLIAVRADSTWAHARFDASTPVTSAGAADAIALQCVLAGGDDYELVFTAPPTQCTAVLAAGQSCGVAVTCIGSIENALGLRLVDVIGQELTHGFTSFDHFR